jgi:hypothetical protein
MAQSPWRKSGFGTPICRGGRKKHPIDMSASSIYPLFADLNLLKLLFSSALPFTYSLEELVLAEFGFRKLVLLSLFLSPCKISKIRPAIA